MNIQVEGRPAFAYVKVDLGPHESIVTESDAMSSMAADLDLKAKFNGGLFGGLIRKFLASESLFINEFSNNTSGNRQLTLVQATPGDIMVKEMKAGEVYYLQPGAFIASEKGVNMSVSWAGFGSWIGGEGLFRLKASGSGKLIFGAYGGLVEKEIVGDYIVDTGHLVSYEEGMKISVKLAGGIFSSLFGGEGIVMKISGKGKIVMQSRNVGAFTTWINRFLS